MQKMKEDIFELSRKFEDNRPKYLYHYTTVDGLLGIVKEQSLRASNIAFMNDSKEYKYGIDLFLKCIEEKKKNVSSTGQRNALEKLKGHLGTSYTKIFFTISYCEFKDQLSQWRGYGSANETVCMEFATEGLRNLVAMCEKSEPGSHSLDFVPSKVIYNRKEQENIVENFIDAILRCEEILSDEAITYASIMILRFSVLFKDNSFHEEREWRSVFMVTTGKEEIFFRTRNGVIIPYIQTSVYDAKKENLPITKIMVGPSVHSNYTIESIETFCAFKGLAINVTRSKIPYR